MALSGTLNSSDYNGRYLQFTWTATQNVENNTSTISWTLKGAGTSENAWYKAGGFKVVIDGSTVYSSSTNSRITLYNGTTVASGTKTITHNSDGSRTFGVSIQGGIFTYAVNCTGSTTFTLNTIPRASTFVVSNASPDMGSSVTFTITRASNAFTHKFTLTWSGKTSEISSYVDTSATWEIPLNLAMDIPNSTSGGCYITCITYHGVTEIGRNKISMRLNVPASVVPRFSSVTISEAVSDLATKFGAYIQNKSKLKVVAAAVGTMSSKIDKYEVKILGKTYSGSTVTSDFITVSGSVSVEVTVTDSRGRTASTSKTVTVTAYSDPKITLFTAQRCNSDGTPNDEGTSVKLSYAFNVTSLNSKNDKSYTIGYKLKSETDYTPLKIDSVYSADTTLIPSTTFSGDNPYDFIIIVTDYFKNDDDPVTYATDIPTAFTLMDFHASGTGMAIGKVAEKSNTLEIALDVEFTGKVRGAIFDAIYPVGSIYLSYNHVNPANLFGGTWARIENAFLWASTANDTIGVTGGEETHTLTVNEMPRHKHNVGAYKSTDGNGSVLDAYTALVSTSNGADTTSKYYTSGTLLTGGSQPHNNMPPYIQVSAWRRTA